MASQTTTTHKRDLTRVEPREQQMRERLGFDRRGLRRELAAVDGIDLTDKHIESEDRQFINPATVDLPYGPNGMGATEGSGMEMYLEEGDQWQTYRFTHGFSVMEEDLRAGNTTVEQQRDEVVQIFDFFADSMFLTGIEDQAGNTVRKGAIQWLKDNIPSNRTFDLEEYDGDSGDSGEDLTDEPENILFEHALAEASGNLLSDDNLQWDTMLSRQKAFSKFNQVDQTSTDRVRYWERINNEDVIGGVSDYNILPDKMEYPYTPDGVTPLEVDLTAELGDDEVILLPDMEAVAENYWTLREMDEPEAFDMFPQGGGQMRQDYAWRYTHYFNPKGHKRWADAEDAIHLKNVSALFS
jgi:hypothetical protein